MYFDIVFSVSQSEYFFFNTSKNVSDDFYHLCMRLFFRVRIDDTRFHFGPKPIHIGVFLLVGWFVGVKGILK